MKKKKIIQIFSNGSFGFNITMIEKLKKINFSKKDHNNFIYNQKNLNSLPTEKNSISFKLKYLKFK